MKKDKRLIPDPLQEKIAGNIVRNWTRMQEGWAGFMQRGLECFSLTGKKYLVICFSILSGGFCLYLLANSIVSRDKSFSIVTPIKKPQHILKTGEPKKLFDATAEYNKIKMLEAFRDSIQKLKLKR